MKRSPSPATVALALVAAFALGSPAPRARAADAASPAPSAAATVTVHTKDFAYAPPVLTIPVGTTVTFVNDDEPAHTVTATDKSFDSGNMDKGAKWSHTFSTAGTFTYFCIYHTFMKAKVVVTPVAPATG